MNNNTLILIITLIILLILSLVWKNVSDNKRADKNENKFDDLAYSKAKFHLELASVKDKAQDLSKHYEQKIADKENEINELSKTIADLSRKLDESKKVGK